MGVCCQLLPVLMTVLVMSITVTYYSSLDPEDALNKLDIDHASIGKCFKYFPAIWKEIDKTKRCLAAMYHRQSSPIGSQVSAECTTHELAINESLLMFQMKSYPSIMVDDVLDFVMDVNATVLRFELCWNKKQGSQCVNGLHDRVSKITLDFALCLDSPTTAVKFWKQIRFVGVLSDVLLLVVLFKTLLPSLRRLSARTQITAILLILAVLLLFVYCHFLCKESLVHYFLKVIASTNVLSRGYLKRIEMVDLDEFIGRNHSTWRPISSMDKTAWRYLGEGVMLYCNVIMSFNTTMIRQEDIEVDWFHNKRRLEFTPRHSFYRSNITVRDNRGKIVMAIIVKHIKTDDFGTYSCSISQRLQPFLTLYLDSSFPTDVHQIFPREEYISIPPGSMLKVKYSQVIFHNGGNNLPKFYQKVNKKPMKWILRQSLEGCNIWTIIQNDMYNMINGKPTFFFALDERVGIAMSFCVSFEDFGRHEFVVEHFENFVVETHTHPVSLIVKKTGSNNKNHFVGENEKSEYFDFVKAVSDLWDILLAIVLSFLGDAFGFVVTFGFLCILKQVLRELIPAVASMFLKQQWRRQKIYIACSQRDRAWTNRNVVEFLESLGQETFLPARDCPPNQLEIEAFAEGVVTCQKYVMVVSGHFLGQEQWTFERSLIVDELRHRQCCQEGEHPTCLLFVCLGASEVPGPRLGGTVLHWAQVRRRGALRFQLRSWLEDTVFCEDEWNTWFLLGVSVLVTISQSRSFAVALFNSFLRESFSIIMKLLSPAT